MRTINEERLPRDVIVIGASAGGIHAVQAVLSKLAATLPAIVGVVIHRGAHKPISDWSATIGRLTQMRVREPATNEILKIGTVYIAPADQHMTFKNGRIELDRGPKEHFTRPSVDRLFTSAAEHFGSRVVGVVLTGGGSDGANGLLKITAAHGICLIQSLDEAEDSCMPLNALKRDHVSAELNIEALGDSLCALIHGRPLQLTGQQ